MGANGPAVPEAAMVRGKPERDNPGAPFRDRVAPSVMQWGTDGAEPCFIIFRIMVPSFIRITPLSINRQFTGRGGGKTLPPGGTG
jgi:hypothetical protein